MPDVMMQGPGVRRGAGLKKQDALENAINPGLAKGQAVVMVVVERAK